MRNPVATAMRAVPLRSRIDPLQSADSAGQLPHLSISPASHGLDSFGSLLRVQQPNSTTQEAHEVARLRTDDFHEAVLPNISSLSVGRPVATRGPRQADVFLRHIEP